MKTAGPTGSRDLEDCNKENSFTRLKKCIYLNIVIPATESIRCEEALFYINDENQEKWFPEIDRDYYDEKVNTKLFTKMQERLMSDLGLEPDEHDEPNMVVKKWKDLETALKNFVSKNYKNSQKLFISFVGHGGEDGSIVTHDKGNVKFTNDDFHQIVSKLDNQYHIPIQVVMGNCYSDKYDKDKLSFNVTVHAAVSEEHCTASYSRHAITDGTTDIEYQNNIFTCQKVIDVDKVKHHQFVGFALSYGRQPNTASLGGQGKRAPKNDFEGTEVVEMETDN